MGRSTIATFMFATGIENSVPTIDGGRTRIDEMESDLSKIVELLPPGHELREIVEEVLDELG